MARTSTPVRDREGRRRWPEDSRDDALGESSETARRSSSPSKGTASSRRRRPSTARSSPRYGSRPTTPDPVAELLPRDRRGRDRRDDGGMVDPDLSGPERRREGTPEDRGREVARVSLWGSTRRPGLRWPDSPRPCARAA